MQGNPQEQFQQQFQIAGVILFKSETPKIPLFNIYLNAAPNDKNPGFAVFSAEFALTDMMITQFGLVMPSDGRRVVSVTTVGETPPFSHVFDLGLSVSMQPTPEGLHGFESMTIRLHPVIIDFWTKCGAKDNWELSNQDLVNYINKLKKEQQDKRDKPDQKKLIIP